ncbi:MAG: nickel pincer cofactor biosynthesis protein LarB [Armatimonadetes bacterium]|nr:nickel pincer cofactor biosynthesis protein LarB [Armatimonadota bacterium]
MTEREISKLLRDVKAGRVAVGEAVERLRTLPFEDLGFAKVDHHRELRTGFPEVIYCAGKTVEQVIEIGKRILARNHVALATRCSPEMYEAARKVFADVACHETAGVMVIGRPPKVSPRARPVAVVSAGTADAPVAEEAAVTAETMGCRVERIYDVGVAGLHRLLRHGEKLREARCIIVVAGMEGALASVVGGLVSVPVVAVPTSVGYGASFEGLSALLTMLNSCAAGVTVVNIDNGFGAGYFAALLVREAKRR